MKINIIFTNKKQQLIFWIYIICLGISYILFTFSQINNRGIFEYIGIDFRLWYSTGQIIKDYEIASVYDLSKQSTYQKVIYDEYAIYNEAYSIPFFPLRLPYLPIFIIPFRLLTLFPILKAFIYWEIVNGLITFLYLLLWLRRLECCDNLLILFMVGYFSIYNFLNLIFSQVNLIILIAIGESIVAIKRNQGFLAGVWLSLCFIKPQCIFPLLPISMLIYKRYRFVMGFTFGGIVLIICSIMFGGFRSMYLMMNLYKDWPNYMGTSGMTWKALSENLVQRGLSPNASNAIGLLIVFAILLAWRRIIQQTKLVNDYHSLGIVYGTNLVAQFICFPYGNIHNALPLLIIWYILIIKTHKNKFIFINFVTWSLFPALIFLVSTLISVGLAHDVLGLLVLFIHVYTLHLFLTIKKSSRTSIDHYEC